MNIIQKIVEEYNGEYHEYEIRKIHLPDGKYEIQPQKGIISIDGTKFTINKNENLGIVFNSDSLNKNLEEPYRIFLYLNKNEKRINIYPKNIFKKIVSKITFKEINGINQYEFKGDEKVIKNLKKNMKLNTLLKGENIYLSINEKYLNKLMLIPVNGIKTIQKFEKYTQIMKIIEREVVKRT